MKNASHEKSMADLDRILTDKMAVATEDRIALRDAVCEYVSAQRARGTSLKHMSQALMAVIRRAAGTLAATDELVRQLIGWCMRLQRVVPAS